MVLPSIWRSYCLKKNLTKCLNLSFVQPGVGVKNCNLKKFLNILRSIFQLDFNDNPIISYKISAQIFYPTVSLVSFLRLNSVWIYVNIIVDMILT